MRVMGMARSGALAEEIVVKPDAVYPMPDNVAAEAGRVVSRQLSNRALRARRTRHAGEEGEQLLVLGAAGGTGTATDQIGKLLGARVIAAASTPKKRDFAPAARCGRRDRLHARPAGATRLKELTRGMWRRRDLRSRRRRHLRAGLSLHRLARAPPRGRLCRQAPFRRCRSACRC